jgi:uncharacterized protein (TIGR02118 family)
MYVTYAGDADTPFDREHWINVHLPLVRECWGPYGLDRLTGFLPASDGEGLIAIATCVFKDKAAMERALASPEAERVMADVELVTSVKPQRSLATPL